MSDRPGEFAVADERLRSSLPFEVVPTNIRGAYVPAAPDSDDIWQGRRSVKSFDKALDRAKSDEWITPRLKLKVGRTHILRRLPQEESEGSYTNLAWAGAAVRSGPYDGVFGFWNVPTVSQSTEAQGTEGGWNSSSWVGIDGWGSNDVLQGGVGQRINANGIASYYAWYEWYAPQRPDSPGYIYETTITNFPVSPGDEMYCAVNYTGPGEPTTHGSILLINDTTKQKFQIILTPPPGANFEGNTAEWITEAPDGGVPTSLLPKFTDVTFSGSA
jgi:hypothetical protein